MRMYRCGARRTNLERHIQTLPLCLRVFICILCGCVILTIEIVDALNLINLNYLLNKHRF